MFHNRAVYIFALVCIIFASESLAKKCRRKPCLISYRCSDLEQVVWATDGTECYIFRNECYLKSENCNRQNRNMRDLKTEAKEECQKKCRKFCTLEFRPVCGIYNNIKRTFSNSCAMGNHICETGETYTLYSNRACDSEPSTV